MTTKSASRWFAGALLATGVFLQSVQAEAPKPVAEALESLKKADNYSWTSETEIGGSQRPVSPVMGKASGDGWAHITQTFGENTTEVVRKGKEGVVKTEDGWKKEQDLPQPQPRGQGGQAGQGGRGRGAMGAMMGRRLLTQPILADQLQTLIASATDWKTTESVHSAQVPSEALQDMVMGNWRGGRGGGRGGNAAADGDRQRPAPEIKGRIKVWVKEGQITRAEVHAETTMNLPNGDSRNMETTTRIDIKDIGKTTLSIPEAAKSALKS